MPHKTPCRTPNVPTTSSGSTGDFLRQRGTLLTLLAAISCSPGTLGKAVRPADPTAAEAMDEGHCVVPENHGNPLIVDWGDYQRDELEVAMKKGVAVVSYDCKTLKMLPDCHVDSSYGFMPTTTKERVVQRLGYMRRVVLVQFCRKAHTSANFGRARD